MKASELTKKKPAELQKMLAEKNKELQELRFGLTGAIKSNETAANMRKDIARIKTVMNANAKEEEVKAAEAAAKKAAKK